MVELPKIPKDKEFEEYVSAFFQCSGYYIERNIIERQIEEVLELDIIITNYNINPPEIRLLEVKSGNWGFPDIFKIKGWMVYLNISKGILITSKEKDNIEFIKKKTNSLSIDLAIIPNLNESKDKLSNIINSSNINDVDIECWRFSYWVERNLLERLNHKKKCQPDKKYLRVLEDCYFKVNSRIFFTEYIISKVNQLYTLFQDYPLLSARSGNELMGGCFDDEIDVLPKELYEETYYSCMYNDIQISTFIEHRTRLAILKNAIDYKLYKMVGDKNRTQDFYIKFLGVKLPSSGFLPNSFMSGLEKISKDKFFHKYSIFWQWFMWMFGGFILEDYKNKDFEILSEKTGIPIDEIPNALDSYQKLFPQDDGWFIDLFPNSNIKIMKMFPVPFMGIGANYRRELYTESKQYKDLKLRGDHTLSDLIKWNNLTIEVLNQQKEKGK
ncbi:MAG: hypothetical protein ABIJ11_07240 [Elusimicrobiota bacterium]